FDTGFVDVLKGYREVRQSLAAQAEAMISYPPTDFPPVFGDGHAAEFICEKMLEFHKSTIRQNIKK
ncbi:MAG TPA: hypothetical protein PLA88_10810, partial [Bacteroidales bacterium]|nr:hypothetical protein [Bacteroidales bacterium]